jgi:hypothetical protein
MAMVSDSATNDLPYCTLFAHHMKQPILKVHDKGLTGAPNQNVSGKK